MTTTLTQPRPTRTVTDYCPTWCVAEHTRDVPDGDGAIFLHESAAEVVPDIEVGYGISQLSLRLGMFVSEDGDAGPVAFDVESGNGLYDIGAVTDALRALERLLPAGPAYVELVTEIRTRSGISVADLAVRMGLSASTLRRVERGDKQVDRAWMDRAISALVAEQQGVAASVRLPDRTAG